MPSVLLLHAGTHGHTATIAGRIATTLEAAGIDVDLRRAPLGGDDPSPRDYDAVIVGASIHAGHHQREIVDWARRHRTELAVRPSAFFSVCLTAADDTDEARAATRATWTSSSRPRAGRLGARRRSPGRSSTATTSS